ncbi:hypothetical protein V6N11_019709 [Hibiscus sabdariffa]|uniref:Secreted protein n=1 Tax=Hibiscus sabdariffa TaxID=183260 RepID=A0ABR2NM15_9ROSI
MTRLDLRLLLLVTHTHASTVTFSGQTMTMNSSSDEDNMESPMVASVHVGLGGTSDKPVAQLQHWCNTKHQIAKFGLSTV